MLFPDSSISENFFLSWTILLAVELVLVEIQYIRVVRPVIPIFEHKLVAEGSLIQSLRDPT